MESGALEAKLHCVKEGPVKQSTLHLYMFVLHQNLRSALSSVAEIKKEQESLKSHHINLSVSAHLPRDTGDNLV